MKVQIEGFPSWYVEWMFRVVKILCVIILGLFLSPLMAADPGEAAIDFLGKVRDGKLDLKPGGDTAVLEHITDGKRESIRKRLARLETELRGGELELGEVKEDGGFAAAMIRKSSGFDSAEIQVFPIALVKRGDKWLAAPMPASFENAVAGYTVPLKERLATLENWMMRKRVTDLEKLILDSVKKTRDLIRNSLVGEDLEGDDLGKITDRFLEACEKGDRAAILGFFGGLSDPLPSDWADRLRASKEAVSNNPNWRWLVSPEVVRVRVNEERDTKDGMVSLACLDPKWASKTGVRLVHLDFSRDAAGEWRIDLPEFLIHGLVASEEDGLDDDLRDLFPEKLRETDTVVFAESARTAESAFILSLKTGEIRESLRKIDFGNLGKEGRKACIETAALWWLLNEPGAIRRPVELGFREEGSLAVVAYQWFSISEPDRYDLRTLFFRKTEQGWLYCPCPPPNHLKKEHATLSKWIEEMEPGWRLSWRETLMGESIRLDKVDFENHPTDDEARALISKWLIALEKKDMGAALACAAWLGGGEGIPMNALRNISHELANAERGKAELSSIHRSASWVAAKVVWVSEGKVRETFLPVVMTGGGARLLPEIDLIAEDTRTRNFLNKAAFGRLGKIVEEGFVVELQKLFEESKKEIK